MNLIEYDVDVYKFIALVKTMPAVWNPNVEDYKSTSKTTAAWREIARGLRSDYESWGKDQQEDFRTYIVKKWKNIKDCWLKSNKKRQLLGNKKVKKYIYEDDLNFLKKCRRYKKIQPEKPIRLQSPVTVNNKGQSIKIDQASTSSATKVSSSSLSSMISLSQPVLTKRTLAEEKKLPNGDKLSDEYPPEKITLTESEDRHVSFIKGIVPSLHKFTENQVLQFQMGVLELIQDIQIKGDISRRTDPLSEPQVINVAEFPCYSSEDDYFSVKIEKPYLSSSCSSFSDDSVTLD